jgi:hypothetical protein
LIPYIKTKAYLWSLLIFSQHLDGIFGSNNMHCIVMSYNIILSILLMGRDLKGWGERKKKEEEKLE